MQLGDVPAVSMDPVIGGLEKVLYQRSTTVTRGPKNSIRGHRTIADGACFSVMGACTSNLLYLDLCKFIQSKRVCAARRFGDSLSTDRHKSRVRRASPRN